jgi:hypothetical protein
MDIVENPFTKRKIEKGGKTYQLVQEIMSGQGSCEEKRTKYLKAIHTTKKLKLPF